MKMKRKWKRQLMYCVGFFFIMLALGYLLHKGIIIILGAAVMCASAGAAERGLRCPNCKESLFKQALERGAEEIQCPKCGKTIILE